MKYGKSLSALAAEIERQQNSKKDFVVSTEVMEMVNMPAAGTLNSRYEPHLAFGSECVTVKDFAHNQISDFCDIPKKYYDRMRESHADLLTTNVNAWFRKNPAKRMVRLLDENCRAFLSDRYRPLENYELCEAILPVLADAKVEVLSCEVTDSKLYIKAVDQRINRDIPSGKKMGDGSHTIFDTVCPAITISNSEIGVGRLMVETSIFTKACTNLATFNQRSLRKNHTGVRHEMVEGELYQLLSDETRRMTDKAVWMQARDVVKNAFAEAQFMALTDTLVEMHERKIEEDPIKVIDLTAKKYGFTEKEKGSVLTHLIRGGDLTQYGLFNAITRTAEDIESYDRATEFEKLGGTIVELNPREWKELALAA